MSPGKPALVATNTSTKIELPMNASTKIHPSRLPLFAADAFGSRRIFPALIDTDRASADRSLNSLVTVTPRVRDNLTLRCVFSRTASLFAPETSHARRTR
jgi:hypothetical protein